MRQATLQDETMQIDGDEQPATARARRNTGASTRAHLDEQIYEDELIGAIDQGTSSTRFLVFERGTGRLVASSQIEIKRITPREGWVEIDPNAIMSSVHATMANVHDQLLAKQHQLKRPAASSPALDTSFMMQHNYAQSQQSICNLLRCIGICNQRESAVVWDSKTGQPLYNVIVWMDNRTKDLVDDMIDSVPGRDFNHLKDKTGLPMSTYFSAFKLRWLIDNVPEVSAALHEKRLLVGTVDSWILWNLTGKHLTDVTNASRTFLMDIETLQWDKTLCKQFKVPMEILPKILSSADDFGLLQFGPFMGTPVTGVIGDQSAALFGHNCLQLGQTKATFGTGCFIMQNIGPGPLNGALSGVQREAKRGLITTVGYKLKDRPVCYALEGSIKIAGAALTWLRDNMQLIQNYEECDQLVNTTTHSAGVFFVPALGGLYSPYWDPNAAGLFIGLSQFTRREHLVRATFDSIAFQTNDILSLMHGVTSGLMIDGGLCKSDNLCQILADITGCDIARPSMCETSALGAAMVAGCGAGIWAYESMLAQAASGAPHEFAGTSKQTHHYPHESLHYDDAKFSHSLVQANTSKCFGSTKIGTPPSSLSQQLQATNNKTRFQRRSVRHRNGGRLMRNLDAGGGINDDAGGGEGVDGGGGGLCSAGDVKESRLRRPVSSVGSQSHLSSSDDDDDDADNASSGGLLVGEVTDFDMAISSDGHKAGATLPAVIENSSLGTSMQDAFNQFSESNKEARARALTSLIGGLNQQHGAPSSSGYSSGDNFELATTNSTRSAVTDSARLLGSGGVRPDSPVSQITDTLTLSGRDSINTNHADELANPIGSRTIRLGDSRAPASNSDLLSSSSCNSSASSGEKMIGGPTVTAAVPLAREPKLTKYNRPPDSKSTFPFNLTSYISHQRESTTYSINQLVTHLKSKSTTGHAVQAINNRKFVANAEDVADEVHEFGGRDSYGEDGYDSSTISFDSYEDEDNNELIGCDEIDQCELELKTSDKNDSSSVINNQTVENIHVLCNSFNQQQQQPHRRRQDSLQERKMDVFQPYISLEHRTELVDTWRLAVSRSMQWTKVHHEEIRRIDYQRLSSLPISMYVFFSIGLVALSGFISSLSASI